ncbi:MAG: tetratricopeptide repeat protein [Phycisphaerae bacterium]|nr:tetratricopeptide repeat protein [Phycisphaerae bacterium]
MPRRCLAVIAVLCAVERASADQTSSAPTTTSAPSLADLDRLALTGRYDQALSAYDRIAENHPDQRIAASLGAASVLERIGRYAEALNRLDALRREGDALADWHLGRARVLEAVGRYQEAIQACHRALALQPDSYEARFRCGALYETIGLPENAIQLYRFFDELARKRVPDRPDQLLYHGKGFYRYSVLTRNANLPSRTRYVLHELFQPVYEIKDPEYWPARLASAELLLAKYNLKEAGEDFKAALELNPNLPPALVGLAAVDLEEWKFEPCEKRLAESLKINPNHVPSINLQAKLRLTERRYDKALEAAQRALEVNPNDLESLSLAAAAQIRLGRDAEAKTYEQRATKTNPRCALLQHTIAEWLSAARQFPRAEKRYLAAAELDPTWADPRTSLGLMYMQWGREEQARKTLEAAWELDRFDRKTYNVLQLLGQVEKFDQFKSDHFVLKLDAAKDAVLAPYFTETLESLWPGLCRDYGFTPKEKIIVEVFPSHRAFSVRITSRPWIHTIGACTGPVIAMDAPRIGASLTGAFDWARVLEHELTHTVTLAATENRIPHWFTEALAVRQETRGRRNFRWMLLLSQAVRRDRLFPVGQIDWSFIRPTRPGDREQAYAQSEWMADFIVAELGYKTILEMLALFRQDQRQPDVILDACGMSEEAFDRRFHKWAQQEVQKWGLPTTPIPPTRQLQKRADRQPKDSRAQAELAEALLYDGQVQKALETATRALELDADNPLALTVKSMLLMETWQQTHGRQARDKLSAEAAPLLSRLAELDPQSLVAPRYLSQLAMEREDLEGARPWLERLRRVSPHDPIARHGFAALYLRQGQKAKALDELAQLTADNDNDPELPVKIADLCAQLGRDAEAADWLYRGIRIDPYDPDVHEQLAGLCVKLGRTDEAIREFRALGELQPKEARHFARLAIHCKKRGRLDEARQAAKRAVSLDPDSPVKQLLEP